jgi:phosphatidylethanolamine/phosphatidyl-N-methylethanolamine N-methyltransferase
LADRGVFFKKFLQKGRTISSAVPSSRMLAARVLQHVDFSRPATIVELGAGTGPITEQIVEHLRPHHRFVAVEDDPDFCDILRRRFPEVTLLEMDATKLTEPLARMGIDRVDYVLSGLPAPNLPPRAAVRLWRWLRRVLAPEGLFVQITIVPLLYRSFYDRLFQSVNYRMVWWNMPPGGVYRCSQPRPHLARQN